MHASIRRSAVLALSLAVLAAAGPAALAEDPALPPGVVARVCGEDVTEAQLLDRLARRYESTDRGRQILDQIVEDEVVALEARRRGISVTEPEARAWAEEKMAEVVKMRGGEEAKDPAGWQRTLDKVLAETSTTREEFYRSAREYLIREKMARADLGTKPGDELPEHRMKLWSSELRRRTGVRTTGLPAGVLARIGDSADIDRRRFAQELRNRLPVELVAGIRAEIVIDIATRSAVQKAGVAVTDADVDAQLARLRERFEKNPRVQGTGVTFDSFLRQTFGIGESELRTDPAFRSRVGLERMLGARITDDAVRKHWDENRAAYGERALVRQVFVAATEEGAKLGANLPSFREANDLALRAKVEILDKAGLLRGGTATGNLGEIVTATAKRFETDAERRKQAGEPVAWTRANVAGEPALETAVFGGDSGGGAIGTLVGPIRSQLGCHLVYVEERRPAPAWDEVRPMVREDLLRVAVRNFQIQLRADGDVVYAPLR